MAVAMNRLSFGKKIIIGCLVMVTITVVTMGTVGYIGLDGTLRELGQATLRTVTDEAVGTLRMQNDITQEKVSADLVSLEKELARFGALALDRSRPVTMTITNQVTKQTETVSIPTLLAGGQTLTGDFTVVDDVQATVGGTATIFQVLDGKLLRVSTNVRKLDGNRATGTYIPADSPVYKTVMNGETYRGKAFVVNDWFITAYKPLRDASGAIIAVAYVGRQILTSQLSEFLGSVNVAGKGYSVVFNSQGDVLFHPDRAIVGKNLKDYPFGQLLLDADSTLVDYDLGGLKYGYVKRFEPWDWSLMVTLAGTDLRHGTDRQLVKYGLMSGGAALAVALVLAWLFTVATIRPVLAAVKAAGRASGGDLSARIDVRSQDEIGQLCATFNQVMDRIEESMRENSGYVEMLNAVPDPIYALDDAGRVTIANEATVRIAGKGRERITGQRCSAVFGVPEGSFRTAREATTDAQRVVEIGSGQSRRSLRLVRVPLAGGGAVELAKDITDMVLKERELQKNLEHIGTVNANIQEAGITLAEKLGEVASQIEQVRSGADVQSARAAETATAMEEMNSTVLEVARNASAAAENASAASKTATQGVQVVADAVTSITEVQTRIKNLQQRMGTLGTQAEGIGQIIGVINDIADQTNLLALNAAIEAARAGDAGRGFAVVADEVRKLAEKTMTATKEVEQAVGAIQGGAREAIGATEQAVDEIARSTEKANQSGQRLREIQSIVDSTAGQVQSIATAAEQQSASSEEITQAVDDMSRISNETAQGMSASAEAVDELERLAARLKELAS
jgi:methyl-accepting chemotaxis protein